MNWMIAQETTAEKGANQEVTPQNTEPPPLPSPKEGGDPLLDILNRRLYPETPKSPKIPSPGPATISPNEFPPDVEQFLKK